MTDRPFSSAIVRLRVRTMAMMFATIGAIGLFGATSALLIRGGEEVGRHLRLLDNYLPGFRVTWPGAFLGLGYGAVLGAVVGAALALVYNAVARRRSSR